MDKINLEELSNFYSTSYISITDMTGSFDWFIVMTT